VKAIVPDIPELAPLRQALSDQLRWLAETHVPGIIIGGVAASLLGRPRLTRDVDALLMLDAEKFDFWHIGLLYLHAGQSLGYL